MKRFCNFFFTEEEKKTQEGEESYYLFTQLICDCINVQVSRKKRSSFILREQRFDGKPQGTFKVWRKRGYAGAERREKMTR